MAALPRAAGVALRAAPENDGYEQGGVRRRRSGRLADHLRGPARRGADANVPGVRAWGGRDARVQQGGHRHHAPRTAEATAQRPGRRPEQLREARHGPGMRPPETASRGSARAAAHTVPVVDGLGGVADRAHHRGRDGHASAEKKQRSLVEVLRLVDEHHRPAGRARRTVVQADAGPGDAAREPGQW